MLTQCDLLLRSSALVSWLSSWLSCCRLPHCPTSPVVVGPAPCILLHLVSQWRQVCCWEALLAPSHLLVGSPHAGWKLAGPCCWEAASYTHFCLVGHCRHLQGLCCVEILQILLVWPPTNNWLNLGDFSLFFLPDFSIFFHIILNGYFTAFTLYLYKNVYKYVHSHTYFILLYNIYLYYYLYKYF